MNQHSETEINKEVDSISFTFILTTSSETDKRKFYYG